MATSASPWRANSPDDIGDPTASISASISVAGCGPRSSFAKAAVEQQPDRHAGQRGGNPHCYRLSDRACGAPFADPRSPDAERGEQAPAIIETAAAAAPDATRTATLLVVAAATPKT